MKASIRVAGFVLLGLIPCALLSLSGGGEAFTYDFRGPIDEGVWIVQTYTFEGNECVFDPSEAIAGKDRLALRVSALAEAREGRKYAAACLQTVRFFEYGTFTVRMKSPIPSGTVSGFFLMNRWQEKDWIHQEIDVEFLGKDRRAVQSNVHKFRADSESAAGEPFLCDLPFDIGEAFHDYGIRWEPDRITWLVDGKDVRVERKKVPDEALSILINFWIPDPDAAWARDWAGPFDDRTLPAFAEYQWIRYEPLKR